VFKQRAVGFDDLAVIRPTRLTRSIPRFARQSRDRANEGRPILLEARCVRFCPCRHVRASAGGLEIRGLRGRPTRVARKGGTAQPKKWQDAPRRTRRPHYKQTEVTAATLDEPVATLLSSWDAISLIRSRVVGPLDQGPKIPRFYFHWVFH